MVTLLQWHPFKSTYMNIASENGCESPDISGKKLKNLIMEEIQNVEFCKPRKANEFERVVLKSTRDFAIAKAEVRDERTVMSPKVYLMLLKF